MLAVPVAALPPPVAVLEIPLAVLFVPVAVLKPPLAFVPLPVAVAPMPVADELLPHSVDNGFGPSLHSGVASAHAGVVIPTPMTVVESVRISFRFFMVSLPFRKRRRG